MSWTDELTELRDALAVLYPREVDGRRIAQDAKLPVERIEFSPVAINNWNAILAEAQKQRKVATLIELVRKENAVDSRFNEAAQAYLKSDNSGRFRVPPPGSVGFRQMVVVAAVLAAVAFAVILVIVQNRSNPDSTPSPTPVAWAFEGFSSRRWKASTESVSSPPDPADETNPILRFTPLPRREATAFYQPDSGSVSQFNALQLRISVEFPNDQDIDPKTAMLLYLVQADERKSAPILCYVQRELAGWQTVTVPLTDFHGELTGDSFDRASAFSEIGFTVNVPFSGATINVDDLTFLETSDYSHNAC